MWEWPSQQDWLISNVTGLYTLLMNKILTRSAFLSPFVHSTDKQDLDKICISVSICTLYWWTRSWQDLHFCLHLYTLLMNKILTRSAFLSPFVHSTDEQDLDKICISVSISHMIWQPLLFMPLGNNQDAAYSLTVIWEDSLNVQDIFVVVSGRTSWVTMKKIPEELCAVKKINGME